MANRTKFSMQWHITDRCDQRCKHCYIYEGKDKECSLELGLDILEVILNDFIESCDRLDRVIEDGEGGTCELQDLLKFDDNSYDSVINEYERRWNEIYNSLSLRERSIIYWLDLNYTQKEIGEMIGISQSYASRLITKLRSKIQEKWKESE